MALRRKLKCLIAIRGMEELEKQEKKRKRTIWVNDFLAKREDFDIEKNLLKDLLWERDGKHFKNFCRLSHEEFQMVLSMVKPFIEKEDTIMRTALTPDVKLAVTLRYLASGDSYRSLEFLTRISRSTISVFIPDVLRVMWEVLQPLYMKMPSTEEEWLKISKDFMDIWNFPHTLGSLDGKHVRIKAPPNEGSNFYNYKGFHSIILLALVNAHCKFVFIDVGANGRASDSTIYQSSFLHTSLKARKLNVPAAAILEGDTREIPYFFIADDAFQLDCTLMKPYSRSMKLTTVQEVYNYRLCRARLTVEAAFGRLASRFRIFHRPIEVFPNTADLVIKTSCVLHNMLTKEIKPSAILPDLEPDNLPETITCDIGTQIRSSFKNCEIVRKCLANFCVGAGDYAPQWEKIKTSK